MVAIVDEYDKHNVTVLILSKLNGRDSSWDATICGVVVLLSELYIAESKGQVYGSQHNYYVRYPHAAQRISNIIGTFQKCGLILCL